MNRCLRWLRPELSADDLPAKPDIPAQDDMDKLAAGVKPGELQQAIDPMLKPLIAAIIKDGPEAALKEAGALYHELDDSSLIDLLTRAIFVADLGGRLDATSH